MEFNKKKLLEYQIEQILLGHDQNIPYEILVVTNFETTKILKYFNDKATVVELENKINPVAKVCIESKYSSILFIDYGCIYSYKIIRSISSRDISSVATSKYTKSNQLDIGITINNSDNTIHHLFFDIPNSVKFANMFYLLSDSVDKIKNNINLQRYNLMYFEILNHLINMGDNIYNTSITDNLFIFFNNMRQKNAITKFIKQNSN
jgi:hypothetical protein